MKSLLIFALFSLSSFTIDLAGTDTPLTTSIVMEDTVMLLTTSDSSTGVITDITIYDQNDNFVTYIAGCGTYRCQSDLSALANGTYKVEVETSTAYVFSDYIVKG